ncbi:probable pectinesterase 55 [Eucalyptus grandis]|nr:probable pectinesterase 55 [Eucalyptus grandis]
MQYSLLSALLLALLSLSRASFNAGCSNHKPRTIVVDQSGHGQFTKVQQAIDSVPTMNSVWTRILVKSGIYKEKVIVPSDKPCIVLEGSSASKTIIEWGDAIEVVKSATFTVYAENFKAKDIMFKNTYNENTRPGDKYPIKQAPAFQVTSDKVSFYRCRFISVQDTLSDLQGRHYFRSCYIQGAIDFIWGYGQSVYQGCLINATTGILGRAGYITAQGRDRATDSGGYVFNRCIVVGTGPVYLGRAYGPYSRVVFYKTSLSNVVMPQGWSSWHYPGQESKITYVETGCTGPGADMSGRVKWEKTLSNEELQSLADANSFVNQDGWLQKQPF